MLFLVLFDVLVRRCLLSCGLLEDISDTMSLTLALSLLVVKFSACLRLSSIFGHFCFVQGLLLYIDLFYALFGTRVYLKFHALV